MDVVDTLGLARQRSLTAAAGPQEQHRLRNRPACGEIRCQAKLRRQSQQQRQRTDNAPETIATLGVVGVHTYHKDRTATVYGVCGVCVRYIIRAAGSDGIARTVVSLTLEQLAVLREELHTAGVTAASETPFYPPPSAVLGQVGQASVLDEWLAAQLSDELSTPVLNKFLRESSVSPPRAATRQRCCQACARAQNHTRN